MIINNDDKNELFIETIKSLLEKFTSTDRTVSDESVKREIQHLKGQVEDLKVTPDVEKKIRELYETINELNRVLF